MTKMAVPLFIFAATVCRFVRDTRWDPEERLAIVLQYQTASQTSRFNKTYLPILDQLVRSLINSKKDSIIKEFQEIINLIIILINPLSTTFLASLLDIPQKIMNY